MGCPRSTARVLLCKNVNKLSQSELVARRRWDGFFCLLYGVGLLMLAIYLTPSNVCDDYNTTRFSIWLLTAGIVKIVVVFIDLMCCCFPAEPKAPSPSCWEEPGSRDYFRQMKDVISIYSVIEFTLSTAGFVLMIQMLTGSEKECVESNLISICVCMSYFAISFLKFCMFLVAYCNCEAYVDTPPESP